HWNRRLRAAAPAPARVATATCLRDLLPAAGTPHEAEEEAAAPLVRAGAALDPRTDDLAVRVAGRTLVLEANPASFGPDTLRGIGDHLDAVLDQCAAGRALADVDLLTDREREFLERHGGRPRDYPATTLHELVARQARRTPDAVALSHGEQRLGYRRLDRAANTVAHRLAELGVGPGTLVAVAGGRCLELFVALLGVLKAGGAIVHLDPAQPDTYHSSVVAAAGLRIVVVAPGGAVPAAAGSALAELPVHGILAEAEHADTPPGGGDSGNPEHPGKGAGPEDPAYVIFTSGTTGRPKGVVRPHRMHTSRIDLEQSMYGLGPSDRVLLKSAVSFREFLWPLAVGARAVIAREGGDRDDRYLLSLMREERLTVVSFVPSMLRLLAADPAFAELDALRHIFVGGEKFPRDLEQRLIAQGHAVHNTYTLTEADYVLHRRGPTDQPGTGSVAGRALDMRVYLCDPDGRRVPPGVVGEIRTGGPGLATGYLDQPAETARRFVPNPFEGPPGAAGGAPLLFRTGDLARFLPNGEVEYLSLIQGSRPPSRRCSASTPTSRTPPSSDTPTPTRASGCSASYGPSPTAPPWRACEPSWPSGRPRTRSPRTSCCSTGCPCCPAARRTARPSCRSPATGRRCASPTYRRAPTRSAGWPRSGAGLWGWTGSGATTTSPAWAAIRCGCWCSGRCWSRSSGPPWRWRTSSTARPWACRPNCSPAAAPMRRRPTARRPRTGGRSRTAHRRGAGRRPRRATASSSDGARQWAASRLRP
ncbi:hypothetical protein ADK38_01325, partial [Streptomyces varsoviensis]